MGQRIESRAAIEKRIRTSLENLVFALGEAAGADRSSPFVVDEERAELRLALAKTEGGRPARSADAPLAMAWQVLPGNAASRSVSMTRTPASASTPRSTQYPVAARRACCASRSAGPLVGFRRSSSC